MRGGGGAEEQREPKLAPQLLRPSRFWEPFFIDELLV